MKPEAIHEVNAHGEPVTRVRIVRSRLERREFMRRENLSMVYDICTGICAICGSGYVFVKFLLWAANGYA